MVLGLGFRAVFLDWKMATSLPSDENESANFTCQRHHGALTPTPPKLFLRFWMEEKIQKDRNYRARERKNFGNHSKSNSHTISPSHETLIAWIIKGWHSTHCQSNADETLSRLEQTKRNKSFSLFQNHGKVSKTIIIVFLVHWQAGGSFCLCSCYFVDESMSNHRSIIIGISFDYYQCLAPEAAAA